MAIWYVGVGFYFSCCWARCLSRHDLKVLHHGHVPYYMGSKWYCASCWQINDTCHGSTKYFSRFSMALACCLHPPLTPDSLATYLPVSQKIMERGVNKFNVNPKDGIAYLIDNGLVTDSAQGICSFLCTAEGLSKRRLGEYFGRVRMSDKIIVTGKETPQSRVAMRPSSGLFGTYNFVFVCCKGVVAAAPAWIGAWYGLLLVVQQYIMIRPRNVCRN